VESPGIDEKIVFAIEQAADRITSKPLIKEFITRLLIICENAHG